MLITLRTFSDIHLRDKFQIWLIAIFRRVFTAQKNDPANLTRIVREKGWILIHICLVFFHNVFYHVRIFSVRFTFLDTEMIFKKLYKKKKIDVIKFFRLFP